MRPKKDTRLHRELASFALALVVAAVCLAAGHFTVEKLLGGRAVAETPEKKPTCTTAPRLAGFGAPDCESEVKLYPMRFH